MEHLVKSSLRGEGVTEKRVEMTEVGLICLWELMGLIWFHFCYDVLLSVSFFFIKSIHFVYMCMCVCLLLLCIVCLLWCICVVVCMCLLCVWLCENYYFLLKITNLLWLFLLYFSAFDEQYGSNVLHCRGVRQGLQPDQVPELPKFSENWWVSEWMACDVLLFLVFHFL
jgi:hypothetical protein